MTVRPSPSRATTSAAANTIRAAAPSSNCWSIGWSTTRPWSTKSPPTACPPPWTTHWPGLTSVVIGAGLDPAIAQACTGRGRTVTTDSAPHVLSPQELDAIDAVVTTARVAIAMSGTIILDGGPGQGRRAITLVPDRHMIILTADQIVETVAEAIALLNPTAPLTMIAGPSATSDIELERVEGVHGPRTLHVIIIG